MPSSIEAMLLQLRSAHHVLRYNDHFDLSHVLSSSVATDVEREEEIESKNKSDEEEGLVV